MPSRLELMIRRVEAQRACLDAAAARIAGLDGVVLEIGLGNGRTYDHLRKRLPDREIFVFDREVAAHPDCIPDSRHMLVGRFQETLPTARARIGAPAALVHGDFGSADAARDAALAAWLGPALEPLVRPGAIIVADRALTTVPWSAEPLPPGIAPGTYFMYRVPTLAARSDGGPSAAVDS